MSNNNFELQTPVLFLVFNRPDTTEQVFEAIRQARPPRLYVAADGPRSDRLGEAEKVKLVRDYVMDHVDWECEVKTLFRENNLGCRVAVSSAIDWFFENEEMGIILEDDCLPNHTFFVFCEQLLYYYLDDKRVMAISGSNPLQDWKSALQSYHFSYYGGIWGWATWKRAWKYYDIDMKLWSNHEVRQAIRGVIGSDEHFKYREEVFSKINKQPCAYDTWDYQWLFARLVQSGLCIVSSVNLVSNIGFGVDATHTKNMNSKMANIKNLDLKFPLLISSFTAVDRKYDEILFNTFFRENNLSKIKKLLRQILPQYLKH